MKKFLFFLAFALWPFTGYAQTPGAQPEFCVTSPSQTTDYNQTCISASSSGGAIEVTNFGAATGGLGVGTITSGTWNGTPITNSFISTPFTTINGTTCNLGSTCTISSPSAGIVVGTSTVTSGTTNQILYDHAGVVGEITKGNSCIYGTNGSGVPSCLTTLPSGLTLPGLITSSASAAGLTVTSSFTATGLVTNADLVNSSVTVNSVTCTLGSSCSISAAASLVVGSTTVTSGTTNQILYDNGGTLGEITKGNNCVYGTNGSGVPSCVTTLPFIASLATGGTNASLVASTGGVVYSGASALAILAGTATANLPLLSGSSAAPTWATIPYVTSANSGGIPYFSSTPAMLSSQTLAVNCVIYGGGLGAAPATSATNCPTVSNAGAVVVPGAISFKGGIPALSNGVASVSGDSTFGAILTGQGGTFDIVIENKNGSGVCSVQTGVTIMSCVTIQATNMVVSSFNANAAAGTAVGNTGSCNSGITVVGIFAGSWTSTSSCNVGGTIVFSALPTMPTGYVCDASDATTAGVVLQQTGASTTSATFTVRSVNAAANDVLRWKCIGY